MQIPSYIHEDLVDGIHDDVFRGDVFQIDAVNLSAVLYIERHTGWSNHEIDCQFRPVGQSREGTGCAGQIAPRRFSSPFVVYLGDTLLYFK